MHTFYPQETTGFSTQISGLQPSKTSIGLCKDLFVPESKKVNGLREQLGSCGIATAGVMSKGIALCGKWHQDRGSNWPHSCKVQPPAGTHFYRPTSKVLCQNKLSKLMMFECISHKQYKYLKKLLHRHLFT